MSKRRRSAFWAFIIAAAVVGGAALTLAHFLQVEPDFYVKEWNPPRDTDEGPIASDVLSRLSTLMNDLQDSSKASWVSSYTSDELNAFFRQRQSGNNPLISGLLGDVPEPRFAVRDDRLLIAFRYGDGRFGTVVTVEVRAWLVKGQANLVAIQVVGFRAGAVPMPKYLILDKFAEVARRHNAEVNWYRHDGYPVALCQLYANQPRPELQIGTLKIGDGSVTIGGTHQTPTAPQSVAP